jgi:non-canonical (house-cleaning) NTP pyrophosphatase
MKKYIFSVLMAAMAAFTFSSCEDVPEPYTMPTKPETGGTTEGVAKGTGTAADPYNSVAVANYCKTLEAGVESDKEVYIKGKVVSIKEQFSTSFGNGSFYIADDETSEKFYIFRSLYLGNRKWTTNDPELKEGDEVVVCAKVMNYMGNTPETVANKTYLVSLNGKTAGGTTPDTPTAGEAKGDGTAANPFNSVAAQKYTAALEAGVVTDKEFYIKGKVQSIKNQFSADFGNGSFYIADDANSTQFYIFRIYYFGGEKWKEGDMTLKEGDEIVVCAKLVNYMGNTPETNQGGKLISVNGKTNGEGGGTPDTPSKPDTPATGEGLTIDGTTVTLSNAAATTTGTSVELNLNTLGLANQAAVETVKFSDGSTVTFDANGQENGPKFYTNTKGVRVYANNKLIFKGIKKIKQIVMTCDSYNGINYVGNATATIEFSDKTATYTNLYTESTGGGVQLRVKTIKIIYAE